MPRSAVQYSEGVLPAPHADTAPRSERERLARILRGVREAREMSLRAVGEKTAMLEAENPEMYMAVNFNSARKYELDDDQEMAQDFLRAESGRSRAIIAVYFGSVRHFIEATGVDPHLSSADGEKAQPHTRVPLYVQGSYVQPRQISDGRNAAREVILPAPVGDFALEIHGMSMSPALHEGQVAFCRFGTEPKVGRLCVLHQGGRITLAYCIATRAGGVFATLERERAAFTLDEGESLFAWVTLNDPNVPAANLGEPEEVAHSA